MSKIFCERLKNLRSDMLQEELAQELGISRSAVSHLENGRHEPNLELLEKIADLFNVSTDYLIGRTATFNHSNIRETDKGRTEMILKELESLQEENLKSIDKIKKMMSRI